MKQSITLSYSTVWKEYTVKKLTNRREPLVGSTLTAKQVDELIALPDVNVEIFKETRA